MTNSTKPKAMLLISGGIDSPVAGKIAQEKGYELCTIHFSQQPFTDDTPENKSLMLCKQLGLSEMIVVNAGNALKEIADKTYREYYFVLMKRFLMQVSELIAKEKKCDYLITGESLGQVSSQTLSNLNNINQATKIEILRPVLFMNKQEIIDKSITWEFFETSKGPEMCDALASGTPKTRTHIEDILKQEERCNMKELVEKASKDFRVEKTSKKVELVGKVCSQ